MDVGTTNTVTSNVQSTYGAGGTGQTQEAKRSNVSGRTIGQPKLSDQGKKYYEELKSKYKNMDFVLVSSDMKAAAKANASSFANPHKMVVLIDEEKIERMATDEDFRNKYEGLIASAQENMPKLKEAFGNSKDVKGYGMQVNDNGTASFFAVMKKSSDEQTARIQEKRAEKKAEKKAQEKKAEKKEKEKKAERKAQEKKAEKQTAEESLSEKRTENAQVESDTVQDLFGEYRKSDTRIVSASSVEELVRKVQDYQFAAKSDSVLTQAELMVGQNIDFKG